MATGTGRPTCPILTRFLGVAARHAHLTAVVGTHRQLSYGRLEEQVRQWARRCGDLDLPSRSVVAIVGDGGPELAAVFLGVRAAGLVPMLLDGMLPAARRDAMLDAARPAAVVHLPEPRVVARPATPRSLPEGAGYLVFSSGSQGTPKGIVGSAEGLAHFLDWESATLALRPGTRTAMLTSPSFDVVLRDLLLPLLSGGELHIAEDAVRCSPRAVLAWLADHEVSVAHVVPSLAARWVDAAATGICLRWTLFAGEPLLDKHVTRWRSVAPGSRIVNLYGPSETTLAKFWHPVPPVPAPGVQPVGRPLPGTRLRLEPVPAADGADGAAGGYGVTISTRYGSLGYLPGTCTADDLSRLRRRHGVTRFRTRDRGRLTGDGDLVVLGRLDSLVKRHGVFLDLADVEAAAVALPEVRSACCAQPVPSGPVVLAIEMHDGRLAAGPDAVAQLRRRLRPRLGTALPDLIVIMPALPALPSGKLDRGAVAALLASAPPAAERWAR